MKNSLSRSQPVPPNLTATPLEAAISGNAVNFGLVIGLVAIATITVFSNMYITQPVLPLISAEFGVSPATAGLTISSMVLAIAASSVFFGLLSDKVGRKPVMVASVLLLSLPTLLCAIVPGFGWLIACRALQGLLIPGFTATTITYLSEEMPLERRGMAISYYISSTVAGGFFGRLCGGLIADIAGDWRFSFVIFGIIDLGLGLALWRFLPVSQYFQRAGRVGKANNEAGRTSSFNFSSIWVHLSHRPLLGVYLVGISLMFSFLGMFTYLPYYLSAPPFNLSTLVISLVYVAYLVGIFSSPLGARLAVRWGKRRVLGFGFGLMLVGVSLTLVPFLPVVMLGLTVTCFGMFINQSLATALVGESIKVGSGRGSAVSLYQMFFYVGAALGGWLPGILWQVGGWLPLTLGVQLVQVAGMGAVYWLCREKPASQLY